MPAAIREIKGRIKAVKNIQRITKTMQMIATARFTAALQRARATQPYSEQIRQMVGQVAQAAGEVESPLLRAPEPRANRTLLLVISSDRGLCGAYNANVLRRALQHHRAIAEQGSEVIVHAAGKKARSVFTFQGISIAESFTFGDRPKYEDIERLAQRYIDEFSEGRFDAIEVASMKFISNARQVPIVSRLLPLDAVGTEAAADAAADGSATARTAAYEFSPSAEALLDALLPMSVKTALFQFFTDAIVSEQIMRMIAMKAATENAGELRRGLNRDYNRARQAAITTELMEVIAGSAALE